VTGSPASIFSTSNRPHSTSPESHCFPNSIIYPSTPPDYSLFYRPVAKPRAIPVRNDSDYHNLATPPLTPDDGNENGAGGGVSSSSTKRDKDSLDFLMTLFPHHGLNALPFAKSVAISAPNMGAAFDGVVLELPSKPKTLYVDGKSAESVSLRERCVLFLHSSVTLLLKHFGFTL
jgi:hypothetical protein